MAKRNAATAPPKGDATIRPHVAERGEIALNLGDQELILRPTYEAIEGFEAITGKGMLQLTRAALDGALTLGETAQIATECVKAWGRATEKASAVGVNAPRIASLILESPGGFNEALRTVAGMLSLASTGGYTASGNLKAGTATTTSAAPAENG